MSGGLYSLDFHVGNTACIFADADVRFEDTSVEQLKQSRSFCKLHKQHNKELAVLKKRHHKDCMIAQKLHTNGSTSAADTGKSLKKKG